MAWAGMRGLVTLALVLSIPAHAASSLHHEASVIALVVLLCTMVLPGLTLPQLMKVLDLEHGPDAAGDQAIERLRTRAQDAAKAYIMHEAEELPETVRDSMQRWIRIQFGEHAEHHSEELTHWRERARQVRTGALIASQHEMLSARRERGQNPAYVDEVLESIDRMLIAARH